MAKWRSKLELSDVFHGPLPELSAAVASRLAALPRQPEKDIEKQRMLLVESFRELVDDPELDTDMFDNLLSDLYDWGDTPLDKDLVFGVRVCWINT